MAGSQSPTGEEDNNDRILDPSDVLAKAVWEEDTERVKSLLEEGVSFSGYVEVNDGTDSTISTPVAAGKKGNVLIAKLLLGDSGFAAWDVDDMFENACGEGHIELIELLLFSGPGSSVDDQGSEKNDETPGMDEDSTPDYEAAQDRDPVNNLDDSYMIHLTDRFGVAFRVASLAGHKHVIERLLEILASTDTTEMPDRRYIGLYAAAQNLHLDVFELLLSQGLDVENGIALHHACRTDSGTEQEARTVVRMAELLLARGASPNRYIVLPKACKSRNEELIELLLKNGADPNAVPPVDRCDWDCDETALEAALSSTEDDPVGDVNIISLLLRYGADINLEGMDGGRPLQTACSECSVETVEFMLEKGAIVDHQGGVYGSPLQAAVVGGDINTVRLLLQHGANVHAEGGEYGSALHAAAAQDLVDVFELLIQEGAQDDLIGGEHGTVLCAACSAGSADIVRLLLERGVDADAYVSERGTALQVACASGHEEIVQLLLNEGANANARAQDGGEFVSPLQAVCAQWNNTVEIAKLLLEKGAEVDMMGGYSQSTALERAVSIRNMEAVQLLLEYGADVNAGGDGQILRSALRWDGSEIPEVLREHGAQ